MRMESQFRSEHTKRVLMVLEFRNALLCEDAYFCICN